MGRILIIGAIVLVIWAGMEIQANGINGAFNGLFAPAGQAEAEAITSTRSGMPSKRAKNATTDCSKSTPSSPNRGSPWCAVSRASPPYTPAAIRCHPQIGLLAEDDLGDRIELHERSALVDLPDLGIAVVFLDGVLGREAVAAE